MKEDWKTDFGDEYTKRNYLTTTEMDNLYLKRYGTTRMAMNMHFLAGLNNELKILELGCNIGTQLKLLQEMGFSDLWGVDINPFAISEARQLSYTINYLECEVTDTPFKKEYFDLVFTSGLLIHIPPKDILTVMDEIYWTTKKYIWGFEYYSEDYETKVYRDKKDMLWKADFCNMFVSRYPDLKLVKQEKYKYLENDNVDCMYLLEKV
jgi:pseudaminic acid biosynthesis-associated methylase